MKNTFIEKMKNHINNMTDPEFVKYVTNRNALDAYMRGNGYAPNPEKAKAIDALILESAASRDITI